MSWISFPHWVRSARIANPPKALVALLRDRDADAATLAMVAQRWAATVPETRFIALEGVEQPDVAPLELKPSAAARRNSQEKTALDRAAQLLDLLLRNQLRVQRVDSSQLVLVGFGHGGSLALHLLLYRGWSCAGILAIDAQLEGSLPRAVRIDCKVRLIDCAAGGDAGHAHLRDAVALLSARGIDTRGVVLPSAPLSDAVLRHGAAYLGELVATAQSSGRFRAGQPA